MIEPEAKDAMRNIIRTMMPEIPLPDQEVIAGQAEGMITEYGLLRAATVGQVVISLLKNAVYNLEEG